MDVRPADGRALITALHERAAALILRLWRQADASGIPVTRPLWLAYPTDAEAARLDQQWLLGLDVLVAPVVTQAATSRRVYFPAGCWSSPDTCARYGGPRYATVPAPLEALPYSFRCGTRPFGPPARLRCVDRRRFTFRTRPARIVRVVVYVNGRRMHVVLERRDAFEARRMLQAPASGCHALRVGGL